MEERVGCPEEGWDAWQGQGQKRCLVSVLFCPDLWTGAPLFLISCYTEETFVGMRQEYQWRPTHV